ncbi:MAG: hypothetical protein ABIG55_04665 [Candidatus Omnitrophota bacterium]|nr:hypothetical protein [Candidatus Omnitrophota bacterium]
MVLIVKVVSVAIIIWGCVIVLKPRIMKKMVEYMKKEKMFMKVNIIKTVVSVLLVLSASSCGVPWVIFLIGGLGLLSGVSALLLKKKAVDSIINWLETRSVKQICMLGTVVVAVGALLAIAA